MFRAGSAVTGRARDGDDGDDRPCRPRRRGSCRHYDCMMARGEPLPDGVVGYVDGVLYAPAAPAAPAVGVVEDPTS